VTEARHALPARTLPLRPFALAIVAAALVGVAGGLALHRLRAAPALVGPALPELHGQAVWAAGERPAPQFALRDQSGVVVSLRALRGRPVLLTFLGSQCGGSCAAEARRIAVVLRRLPVTRRPTLLVVSLDPAGDTTAAIDRAARRWGLAGAWQWHWLTASRMRLASVWREYAAVGGSPRGSVVLIDRRGDERTAYLFPFLPAFVDGDLARLAGERA
jgi:cytochrome oxidase Cu insertion factor (SCO1/SenC/PrrC family)